MKVWLQTMNPWEDELEIAIERYPFVIGRRSDSDCSLPLAFISRYHCRLTRDANHVLVQDMESYNGTFVNGRRATTPLPISHGDVLRLGPVSFRVVMQRMAQETAEVRLGTTREQEALSHPDSD